MTSLNRRAIMARCLVSPGKALVIFSPAINSINVTCLVEIGKISGTTTFYYSGSTLGHG